MTDELITLKYGPLELTPIEYEIRYKLKKIPYFYFWTRTVKEYWCVCEFSAIGGFEDYNELFKYMMLAGVRLKYNPDNCKEMGNG